MIKLLKKEKYQNMNRFSFQKKKTTKEIEK